MPDTEEEHLETHRGYAVNSSDAKRTFGEATQLYHAKHYAEALQLLDGLDAAFPMNQEIMYPRALCLAALKQPEEAIQVLNQLEMMFQDNRATALKAQLENAAPAASSGPAQSPAQRTAPRPAAAAGFPFVKAGILVAIIAAAAAGAYFYMQRDKSGDSASKRAPRTVPSERGESEQEKIDQAMRRQMELSSTPPFSVLYDTGTESAEALDANSFAGHSGWTQVGDDQLDYSFRGDAVLMNNQVILVLRKQGAGGELYGRPTDHQRHYATIAPGGEVQGIDSISVLQCAQDTVVVEAAFRSAGGQSLPLRYELALGQVFVKMTPGPGTETLRVSSESRFAILPDFFADDMVIDADTVMVDEAELPSENFLLHMVGDEDAIVMDVWSNREQDVKVLLKVEGSRRRIQSSEVAFGEEGSVWTALLTGNGIWHMRDIRLMDKGVEIPLDWRWPFPALWRVDWRRSDKLTDSWEMMTETPEGDFQKHGMFSEEEDAWTAKDWWGGGHPRMRIASGYGRFHYPCWTDRDGWGWIEPLMSRNREGSESTSALPEFVGPMLLYPLNRLDSTPLEDFTVVDVVRGCLGVGPCEYILDIEGQHENFEGFPTCTVRDVLDDIYGKGQQKARRDDVEKALENVVAFVALIRGRIDEYHQFAEDMLKYLDEQWEKNLDQRPFIEEMQELTRRILTAYESREENIKSVREAEKLAKKFRSSLLDYDGSDALSQCQEYTKAWVEIGGNQDTLVAECRMAVKQLRQRAALSLTWDPGRTQLVEEIRTRTENVLRNPVNYEAPRH